MKVEIYQKNKSKYTHVYKTILLRDLRESLPLGFVVLEEERYELSERFYDNFYNIFSLSPRTSRYFRTQYPHILSTMVGDMSEDIPQVTLLLDKESFVVLDTLVTFPNSSSNVHVIDTIISSFEDYFDILDIEIDDTKSQVLILSRDRVTENTLGFLITNDEVWGTSARVVVKHGKVYMLMPSKCGSYSVGRYLRYSNGIYQDALESMFLRMKEDSVGDRAQDNLGTAHIHISDDTVLTCEEYSSIINSLIVSLIANDSIGIDLTDITSTLSIVESMVSKYGPSVEEMMTKYLWRCTALSDGNVKDLLDKIDQILSSMEEEHIDSDLMSELGNVIFSDRILKDIASVRG